MFASKTLLLAALTASLLPAESPMRDPWEKRYEQKYGRAPESRRESDDREQRAKADRKKDKRKADPCNSGKADCREEASAGETGRKTLDR